ncbi:hypothetical protein L596_005402 [Steinernema carpocapsae]|uniref:Xaa-Pro dipeptidase n=1 Tax=Steinernema carpocapsae TaxID=34508 RepID=A0A4U8V0H5_STECR|nr:hypothetical protein L596_005402 [Steinernema carpocapsae]
MSFDRGHHTLHVKADLFVENRRRLVEALRGKAQSGSWVLLRGGVEQTRYNTDADDLPFRQESYFFWTFGVHESDVYGAIELDTGKSVLFPPRLADDYFIWEGEVRDTNWFKEKYQVDEVQFREVFVVEDYLKSKNASILYLLEAENTDSHKVLASAEIDGCNIPSDKTLLYPVIAELRVFKTDMELEVMRYASKIACDSHVDVMKTMKSNMYEYQGESVFRHHSYFHGGCRHLAYTCIAASGENGSTLHYGHANAPNNRFIRDGDMCLFDMGPEYNCYASDVTCSFPVNGKFTEKQKIIYNAVLKANQAVFKASRPGVWWTDMHLLAEKVILKDLTAAGILKGDVEEMVNKRLGAVFQPHGLGHFIGLDVHDVGGYLGDAKPRSPLPGLRSCRTSRSLKERMVITIEPGCYFIDGLLDKALADPELSKFLVREKLDEFRGFGGVRIEDVVVIWEQGNENLSKYVPRTVEEIEAAMMK